MFINKPVDSRLLHGVLAALGMRMIWFAITFTNENLKNGRHSTWNKIH